MKLHINKHEQIVRLESEFIDDFEGVAERCGMTVQDALVAVAAPWIGWGSYPVGLLNFEGTLLVFWAESGFPMTAYQRIVEIREARTTLLGIKDGDIRIELYGPGPDDDMEPGEAVWSLGKLVGQPG